MNRAAAAVICAHATDRTDARELLMMLGLIETPARPCRPRPKHRMLATRRPILRPLTDPPKLRPELTAADLAWMRRNGYLQEAS